jgi:hypothetical protein
MKEGCCSIPMYLLERFETLKEWGEVFNKDCCGHDDRYRGLLYGSWSREISDLMFWKELQETAREYGLKHGEKAGYLAMLAAKDFYEAVRLGGKVAWKRHALTRYWNRLRLFGTKN